MPKTFSYTDPRQIEGNPFEVANAACKQAMAVLDIGQTAVDDAFVMARVANMERECQAGERPDGAGFNGSALGQRMLQLGSSLTDLRKTMGSLARAAAYDPNNPPRE